MSQIQLRRIEATELEEALHLEQRCYNAEAAATREGFAFRYRRYPEYFWSAWLDDRLLGIANGVRTSSNSCGDEMKGDHEDAEDGINFCILTIAVAEEARRQGIGMLLLKQLINECNDAGVHSILLMCERHLISFYEQAGFDYIGEASSTHGGIQWYEMRLNLHTMEHLTE